MASEHGHAAAQRQRDQERAKYLIRIGYPHGRRFSTGLSGFPVDEPGSAAYRRLRGKNARK